MAIHYGLGFLAVGTPDWSVSTMLTIDSFLIGLLALNIYGASYFAAKRAAIDKHVSVIVPPNVTDTSITRQ